MCQGNGDNAYREYSKERQGQSDFGNFRLAQRNGSFLRSLHFVVTLELVPFPETSLWSQRIYPSLPSTNLAFWSRAVGQHSRTQSTLVKQTHLTHFCLLTHSWFGNRTHALAIQAVKSDHFNPQHRGVAICR